MNIGLFIPLCTSFVFNHNKREPEGGLVCIKWIITLHFIRKMKAFLHTSQAYHCVGPHHITKTTLTCWGTDSRRPLMVSCGIRHQHVSSRSFKSSKLGHGASMDQACFYSTTLYRWSDWDLGTLVAKSVSLNFSIFFFNFSFSFYCRVPVCVTLLKETAAMREYRVLILLLPVLYRAAFSFPGKQQAATHLPSCPFFLSSITSPSFACLINSSFNRY